MPKANPPMSDDELFELLAKGDSLHMIIRGTIAIESELRAILELMLMRPGALDGADLEYSQQVTLSYAMGIDAELLKPLQALGTLRNKFAHKIMPEIDKNTINNFIKTMGKRERDLVRGQYGMPRDKSEERGETDPPFDELSPTSKFAYCIIVLRAALIVSKGRLIKSGALGPL